MRLKIFQTHEYNIVKFMGRSELWQGEVYPHVLGETCSKSQHVGVLLITDGVEFVGTFHQGFSPLCCMVWQNWKGNYWLERLLHRGKFIIDDLIRRLVTFLTWSFRIPFTILSEDSQRWHARGRALGISRDEGTKMSLINVQ